MLDLGMSTMQICIMQIQADASLHVCIFLLLCAVLLLAIMLRVAATWSWAELNPKPPQMSEFQCDGGQDARVNETDTT